MLLDLLCDPSPQATKFLAEIEEIDTKNEPAEVPQDVFLLKKVGVKND